MLLFVPRFPSSKGYRNCFSACAQVCAVPEEARDGRGGARWGSFLRADGPRCRVRASRTTSSGRAVFALD